MLLPGLMLQSRCWIQRAPTLSMMAEGGPPQIDWQDGLIVSNDVLARGTNQMRIKASSAVDYKPGHILGFELAHPETGEGLKGPYTVTRSSSDEFDVIYRVIPDGRKTPFMEKLAEGDAVRFGGRFGTPVADGIASECDRVIGVATGAGLGPLVGYAESALSDADGPSVELYCGFRDLQDVCSGAAVEALQQQYPDRFKWTPIISKPMACTAVGLAGMATDVSSASADLQEVAPSFAQGRVSSAVPGMLGEVSGTTHFHLVGNGQFIVDFQAGLLAAGVSEERVTTEKYFNGKAEADEAVVNFIAEAIGKRMAQAAS